MSQPQDPVDGWMDANLSSVMDCWPMCGCGDPETVVLLLRDVLEAIAEKSGDDPHRRHAGDIRLKDLLPGGGIYFQYLYWLDDRGLTSHGSSCGCSWLSEKGKKLLELLRTIPSRED